MMKAEELERSLGYFTGTETWYKLSPFPVTMTEGVKFVADNAECYWLFTDTAVAALDLESKGKDAMFWTLTVNDDGSADLKGEYDSGVVLYRQHYTRTDFPMKKFRFWFKDHVFLLPSEY
jgi:hypothetical protein